MEKRKVYANAALTSTILIKTVAVWHCTFSSMFSCFCSLIFDYSTVMPTLKCRVHLPPPKKMINLTYCLKHLFERNLTGSPTGPTYILQYYIYTTISTFDIYSIQMTKHAFLYTYTTYNIYVLSFFFMIGICQVS